MARLVDLSVALKNNTMDPNDVKITHLTHTASSRRMAFWPYRGREAGQDDR